MKTNYADAIKIELVFEGGKVDNPADPGGRTNQGVTQRTYAAWRTNNNLPAQDVFQMSDSERDSIYDVQYGAKIKFNDLPDGVDLVVLDGAINSGVGQSVKWVQRALGPAYTGKVDGVMGEGTFAAIQACTDYDALIAAILERREAFLRALTTWKTFGKGWLARLDQVQKISQAWATGSVPPVPTYADGMHARAEITDAKKIPSVAPGTGTAGVGGTLATASIASSSMLDQIKQHLQEIAFLPHTDQAIQYVDHAKSIVSASGGIVGILIAACGGAWFWFASRRAAKLHDALDTQPPTAAATAAAA